MSDIMSEKQQGLEQAEEALYESDLQFRAVWENASDAMALSTADGIVFAANFASMAMRQKQLSGKIMPLFFLRNSVKLHKNFTGTYFRVRLSAHLLRLRFVALMEPNVLLNRAIILLRTTVNA